LYNLLLNSTVNADERYGSFSVSQLCDNDTYNGIDLPISTGGTPTYYLNFSVPITTLLGLNSLTNGILFPVGSVVNLQLELITAQILPIVTFCTAQPAAAGGSPHFYCQFKYFQFKL
jgi:hypothetical protein